MTPRRMLWMLTLLLNPCALAAAGSQSLEQVALAAEQHVRDHFTGANLTLRKVTARRPDQRLQLPACTGALATKGSADPLATRQTIQVHCKGETPWSVRVAVALEASARVATLAQSQPRGAQLAAEDLVWTDVPVEQLRNAHVSDPRLALGQALKRSARQGQILYLNMLEAPKLLRRGQSLTLVSRLGGIEVRADGVALVDGAAGDIIAVRNTTSGQKLQGRVLASGQVQIY